MLSFTRKDGEKIMINDGEIVIQIVWCQYGRARVGIKAPRHITIDREEIYQRKQADQMNSPHYFQKIA
jgi:carbon storage regulator